MKKSLLTILCLALVLSICVSVFAACDGDNNETTEYNVSIGEYDETKGTITIDKEKVEAGKEVTVTVTSKEGYEIKSFFIGSNNLTQDFYSKNDMNTKRDWTSGTYKFKVNANSVVRAEFQVRGINGSTDYVYELACEYDSVKGKVTVSPDRSKFAENEAVTLRIELNSNYVLTSILVNGAERVSDAKQAGNNYTYDFTFNITGNSTVKVVLNYDFTIISDIEVNKFNDAINSSEWVLCDFWAPDCSPCVNLLGPSLRRLTKDKKLGNVRVIKVELPSLNDTQSEAAQLKNSVASKLGLSRPGLPFVVLFHNGKEIDSFTGAFSDQTTQDNSVIEFVKKHVE